MLYGAAIDEVKRGSLTKVEGLLAVCMRFYPRFIKRDLIHEYHASLAPAPDLFADFRAALERGAGHDAAFAEVDYERRFELSAEGMLELERLSEVARTKPVYLFCQCQRQEKCHRDLLLLLAERSFGAKINPVKNLYPIYRERLAKL